MNTDTIVMLDMRQPAAAAAASARRAKVRGADGSALAPEFAQWLQQIAAAMTGTESDECDGVKAAAAGAAGDATGLMGHGWADEAAATEDMGTLSDGVDITDVNAELQARDQRVTRHTEAAESEPRHLLAPPATETGEVPELPRADAAPPDHVMALSTSLELLDVTEMLDPELRLDMHPGQLLGRLEQTLNGITAPAGSDAVSDVVVPQLIRGLVTLVREGVAEMRMQLQPPDLGEIELRVRTTEGTVRGEMIVQQAELRELLHANMDRLREALAREGLDLSGFDVDVERDTHSGGGMPADEPWHDGRGRGRGSDKANPGVGTATEPPATGAVTGNDQVIDYTI